MNVNVQSKVGLSLGIVVGCIITFAIVEFGFTSIIPDNNMHSLTMGNIPDGPVPMDIVTVTVHDKNGNLVTEQKTHNIITTNGAVWYCIAQNRCTSQITGVSPAVPNVAGATYWVQFIHGPANTNEPTAADCTSPSGGGAISGNLNGTSPTQRCIVIFGSPPAQYQSGGYIVSVSTIANNKNLTGTGTFDSVNRFVQTTRATTCSVINDGSAPSSGTCQFSETTPVLTNNSGQAITINGLALSSGTNSAVAAGPLIIAETTITPITLQSGDTVSVTWTITT
ncbi:conserved exported protein of unknown function [Candidatus Nitrosotalea okcheonensis]|uniref:Uncharacterized protein n=1 Tax=Candidatus Nitrosotalea okcheonensis TaxID=1903276 RepID=A0A2H1FI47_9ARCH|nr:conserved exported protein of unknown function [Candidatus Nitrosotalea okcheonensis]